MQAETPSISGSTYSSTALDPLKFLPLTGGNMDAPMLRAAHNIGRPRLEVLPKEKVAMANSLRLVQVFIADPDENISLDKRLLYSGEQKLTDLTDQELFFEIDIKSLMDKHNEVRKATIDKAVKERTEYLEPARIRDLKMTVVTIAQF